MNLIEQENEDYTRPILCRQLTGIGDDHDYIIKLRNSKYGRLTWINRYFTRKNLIFNSPCKLKNRYEIFALRNAFYSIQKLQRNRYKNIYIDPLIRENLNSIIIPVLVNIIIDFI